MIIGQWSTTLIILILVILPLLILGVLFFVLTDKKDRKSKLISMIVSKTLIGGFISATLLGSSLIYTMNFTNSFNGSPLLIFIDTFLFIPLILPFAFGYEGGEVLAFFVFFIEFVLLTMFIRFFISDKWIERINQKQKIDEKED